MRIPADRMKSRSTLLMSCSLLALFSAAAESQPFSAETDDPLLWQSLRSGSASDLVRLCTSAHRSNVEYCEGFLDFAAKLFRREAACDSEASPEWSFCLGSMAAEDDFLVAEDNCPDCSHTQVIAMVELCTSDSRRDEQFCAGYNTAISVASTVTFPDDLPPDASPREHGQYGASTHYGVFVLAPRKLSFLL